MRSMANFTERDLGTMLALALAEMAYRRRKSVQELLQALVGLPELWEVAIDESSGAQTVRLTAAGHLWRASTGRSSQTASTACSSRSRRSSSSSTGSRKH